MLNLARIFVDYDLDLLQVIAAQWDADLSAQDRPEAAGKLAEIMARLEAVEATLARLTDTDRAALDDLLRHDGKLPYAQFTRQYGDLRPMGPARRERERPWLDPASVTESLYYRGLIARAFLTDEAGVQEYVIIPAELRPLLPQPEQTASDIPPGYPVAPPRQLKGGETAAPDDAATLIAYLLLRQDNARPWLASAPAERIDRHLRRAGEPAYRAMLAHLLYDLELVEDQEVLTHVVSVVNKEAARPWLEAPRSHQMRSLAETWLRSTRWNELAFTPGLEADDWPNDPRLARQVVLDGLRQVPAEIWWSLDGFVEYLKAHNPDFQRPGGDYAAWYLRDAYTGEVMHGFQYWDHIEGALIRFIVEGPMRWLGLALAGRGAFLLTPSGMALLGRGDWPSDPDTPRHVRVDEQGLVYVPSGLSRYDRVQIARFAAWVSPAPLSTPTAGYRQGGSLYQYRLTPQAIARAVAEGIELDAHIIPYLQRLCGGDLPRNVEKLLRAWHERPGEVVVQDVVIVRARNVQVYQSLRENKRANQWLGEQVGPHAHAVRREDMPALMNALREMGLLPLFEGHEKDDWP